MDDIAQKGMVEATVGDTRHLDVEGYILPWMDKAPKEFIGRNLC